MTFLADPARTTPHTRLAPARGSSRRDSAPGQLGDQLAEGVGQVLGQVRARGVPAAAGQPDRQRVGGAGQRADPQPDLRRRRWRGRSAGRRRARRPRGRRRRSPRARRRASPPRPAGTAAGPGRAAGTAACACGERDARRRPARRCARRGRRRGRRPSTVLAHGSPPRSSTGQRVEVGAQRDERAGRRRRARRSARTWAAAGRRGRPARAARRPARWSAVSCQASSGWACRSRRSATSSLSSASTASTARRSDGGGHDRQGYRSATGPDAPQGRTTVTGGPPLRMPCVATWRTRRARRAPRRQVERGRVVTLRDRLGRVVGQRQRRRARWPGRSTVPLAGPNAVSPVIVQVSVWAAPVRLVIADASCSATCRCPTGTAPNEVLTEESATFAPTAAWTSVEPGAGDQRVGLRRADALVVDQRALLGRVRDRRADLLGRPVRVRRRTTAAVPARCGLAIDVPLKNAQQPSGFVGAVSQ